MHQGVKEMVYPVIYGLKRLIKYNLFFIPMACHTILVVLYAAYLFCKRFFLHIAFLFLRNI